MSEFEMYTIKDIFQMATMPAFWCGFSVGALLAIVIPFLILGLMMLPTPTRRLLLKRRSQRKPTQQHEPS